MRFVRALILVGVIAAAFTPDAVATRFADTPCTEAPDRSRTCPAGVVGKPYRVTLTGEGGCGPSLPYQFRLLNGALPRGLALDEHGVISGIPTKAGLWSFWVELSDEDPPSASWCLPKKSEREFTLRVGAPPGTAGLPYLVAVSAPGVGEQRWSVSSGTLPPGLILSEAGLITGTPLARGTFPFQVSDVDSQGQSTKLDLAIVVYPRLSIATTRIPSTEVGRQFRAKIGVTGAVGTVTLTVGSGRFPTGLRLDGKARVIRGRPHNAGSYRVTLVARDEAGRTARRTYLLTVRASSRT